jgi:diacylglycerol O-acyltransferase
MDERLTALDVTNLRVEDRGMPMHVAALAILDGTALVDSAGELRLEALRRHVDERTYRARRLRQVLAPAGRWSRTTWVDDTHFDVTRHVHTRRVPDPGDEASLLALCCELNEPPLDRGRPLWEIWLLTGLAGGRIAMLVRFHHVIADGMAALALFASMWDLTPDPAATAGGLQDPVTAPLPPDPRTVGGRVVMWTRQARALLRQGRAPALSWNQPVGSRRRVMLLRADLAAAKAVAHRHGGKVNDVVLAAVGGGARRLLESRGELLPDLVMKVSVAASVRRPDDSGGNRVGVRVVPVPLGEPDAVARLETIAAATSAQRGLSPLQPSGRLLQRWMVRMMARQRMVNLLLSNLPGPPVPLYFAGARMEELFQVGVVQGNVALAVGVLSYAGRLNLDVVADADVVPDVASFTEGVQQALEQLGVVPDL